MRPTEIIRRRLVRIFITDPDKDLPLEKCVLFDSKEKLTDATDSELFLEIGVTRLVLEHNETRREHGLKDVKVRDLTFCVATLVQI